MTTIQLSVNGTATETTVEPRTHLADLLRDQLDLTGTHLGCEHGVCGACTLLLDGAPARSCITLAVACDGATITTIEGLDEDEIAAELRAAFAREHALQCGYCTPGMIMSARDLVLRLDSADEQAIRVGLSGNLCRCTGYVGIVRAVRAVIEARRQRGIAAAIGAGRTSLGPVGSQPAAIATTTSSAPRAMREMEADRNVAVRTLDIPEAVPAKSFDASFIVNAAPAQVFALFGNVRTLAACFPGATITDIPAPDRIEGEIRVALGPLAAAFRGAARIDRDETNLSGRLVGMGHDQRSRTSTSGQISWRMVPIDEGRATRVELAIGYSLSGPLAQIARDGFVRDLAARITTVFAQNCDKHLNGATTQAASEQPQRLNALALLLDVARTRLTVLARRLRRQ
ncbi:2Fe-2S iron-sulfur cluster-binding protein [Bradyrhizobium ontarionense]|uniref:2Fe-2S iron-sulfur cluster-binding protein n=1 Tax=Bradyrhizobium ontarionense TaxID=2898149 RepID=A0ABY3RK22_9BRAD|nr:2Fe-2S iron-sulfur cluster-binding protein [Bradyrhizobium sp. A19]UFZ07162.1 2Fe-2S iron-sulfur cluster-binding protein [Bradyrhizobium sp. A19]